MLQAELSHQVEVDRIERLVTGILRLDVDQLSQPGVHRRSKDTGSLIFVLGRHDWETIIRVGLSRVDYVLPCSRDCDYSSRELWCFGRADDLVEEECALIWGEVVFQSRQPYGAGGFYRYS